MRSVALVVAILLGIVAAVGVRSYMSRQRREFQDEHEMVPVTVAKRTIEAGEALEKDMVTFREVPTDSLGRDMIPDHELGTFLGKKLTRDVDMGMHIRAGHFITRDLKPAGERLSEGKRAITIAVNNTSGVAGLARPGDHLDILATMPAGRGGEPETWRVLSDVTVLAVDDRMRDTPLGLREYGGYKRGYASFTLAVTPLEAQLLVYLNDSAKLTFMLRPKTDLGETVDVPSVSGDNVRQLADQANRERQREIQELERLSRERVREE